MSKTLRTLISIVMKTTVSTGMRSGAVTRRNTCHSVAPVRARGLHDVSRDGGQPRRDHDHPEAGPDPDVGDDDRGGDESRAQPSDAANGSANVSALIATSNWPSPTSSKANVPSASVVVNTVLAAVGVSSSTSRREDRPPRAPPRRVPPPGRSLQTTPLMPPWSGSGRTAWTASSGTSSPEIRVSPSEATLPASTGSASSIPTSASPTSASVDGAASESAPAG